MHDSSPLLSHLYLQIGTLGVGSHFILSTDAQKLHILPNTESSLWYVLTTNRLQVFKHPEQYVYSLFILNINLMRQSDAQIFGQT